MATLKAGFATLVFALLAYAQNGGGSLSGRVTNSVTKAGIGGVEVRICPLITFTGPPVPVGPNAGPPPCEVGVSDDTGTFSITGIAEGQYISLPGSVDGYSTALPVVPTINISGPTHLDLQMTPLVSLRGRVVDPEGKPAPGMVVALDAPACTGCTATDVKITDANGEFAFVGVPPNNSLIISVSPKHQDDVTADEKIVTTYYPSVVDRDQAEAIRSQGLDLFGYEIKLRTRPARRVRGVVIDDEGKPVVKALVSIVKLSAEMPAIIRGARNDAPADLPVAEPTETLADGSFSFPAVVEGNWTLRAVLRQDVAFAGRSGSREVVVSHDNVEDIQIHVASPFEILPTGDWGESPPNPLPPPLATILSVDNVRVAGPPPPPPPPGQLASPQPVLLLPGRYLIGPGNAPTNGYYLAAALLDNRDVLGQVVELSAGSSLKMIYRTGGGSVRGTVEKCGEATVVLMADPTSSAMLGYSGHCDPSGGFAIRDVPPGEYTAVAVAGNPGDPGRPEFVSMLSSSGKRIRVEQGSAVQVDLRVAGQ